MKIGSEWTAEDVLDLSSTLCMWISLVHHAKDVEATDALVALTKSFCEPYGIHVSADHEKTRAWSPIDATSMILDLVEWLDLIVSGGGIHNGGTTSEIQQEIADRYGITIEYKEAKDEKGQGHTQAD